MPENRASETHVVRGVAVELVYPDSGVDERLKEKVIEEAGTLIEKILEYAESTGGRLYENKVQIFVDAETISILRDCSCQAGWSKLVMKIGDLLEHHIDELKCAKIKCPDIGELDEDEAVTLLMVSYTIAFRELPRSGPGRSPRKPTSTSSY
ncbi:MAG: hypothetical protein QXS85_05400 [Acidilobaceae archaeon]